MKKKIIYTLAFLHLFIVAFTISHANDKLVKGEHPTANFFQFLTDINYCAWQYGFFSPDVGKSTELEIGILNSEGKIQKSSTLDSFRFHAHNIETLNRFYGFRVRSSVDTTFQDLCSRSVCTRLFNLHPNTVGISYVIRTVRYPTMQGFLEKEPIEIREFYRTQYLLND